MGDDTQVSTATITIASVSHTTGDKEYWDIKDTNGQEYRAYDKKVGPTLVNGQTYDVEIATKGKYKYLNKATPQTAAGPVAGPAASVGNEEWAMRASLVASAATFAAGRIGHGPMPTWVDVLKCAAIAELYVRGGKVPQAPAQPQAQTTPPGPAQAPAPTQGPTGPTGAPSGSAQVAEAAALEAEATVKPEPAITSYQQFWSEAKRMGYDKGLVLIVLKVTNVASEWAINGRTLDDAMVELRKDAVTRFGATGETAAEAWKGLKGGGDDPGALPF